MIRYDVNCLLHQKVATVAYCILIDCGCCTLKMNYCVLYVRLCVKYCTLQASISSTRTEGRLNAIIFTALLIPLSSTCNFNKMSMILSVMIKSLCRPCNWFVLLSILWGEILIIAPITSIFLPSLPAKKCEYRLYYWQYSFLPNLGQLSSGLLDPKQIQYGT